MSKDLRYTRQKLSAAVVGTHRAHRECERLRAALPTAHGCPPVVVFAVAGIHGDASFPPSAEDLLHTIRNAFTDLMVGVADLHGMLDAMNALRERCGAGGAIDRLLKMSDEDFAAWLDLLERHGALAELT